MVITIITWAHVNSEVVGNDKWLWLRIRICSADSRQDIVLGFQCTYCDLFLSVPACLLP